MQKSSGELINITVAKLHKQVVNKADTNISPDHILFIHQDIMISLHYIALLCLCIVLFNRFCEPVLNFELVSDNIRSVLSLVSVRIKEQNNYLIQQLRARLFCVFIFWKIS